MTTSKQDRLTHARLLEVMSYDPETGAFVRKANRCRRFVGKPADYMTERGYRKVSIDDIAYRAHRLAWFYVYGAWPTLLDHIDGDPGNNAIANLREATRTQNNGNSKRHRDNRSGHKGVTLHRATGRWNAQIGIDGRRYHLGVFTTPEDAAAAYAKAARKIFGEFARTEQEG